MTYKKIEASLEAILRISQVVVTVAAIGIDIGTVIILTNPEIKRSAIKKFDNVKKSVKNKFKKD